MGAKKKVGIMTMHRVMNYGSALQAYALQKKVLDLGFDCEIIDYHFPNVEHLLYQNPNGIESKESFYSYLRPLLAYCKREVMGLNRQLGNKRLLFNAFYKDNFVLSSKQYPTRLVLEKDPPIYDIYLTGSDQVWNSKYVGYDTSFMFSFVKDNHPKVSYAASFSAASIPEIYVSTYRNELKKYSKISVREETGIFLVHDLTDMDAELVCDPTLLLSGSEWKKLAEKSTIKLGIKYILVYILDYVYNPYPEINHIVERISNILKLPIIVIGENRLKGAFKEKKVSSVGPYEFLYLLQNASFVITNSFHGTAFSLNFNIPFYSIVRDKSQNDSRIYGLLQSVNAENRILVYNEKFSDVKLSKEIGTIEENIRNSIFNFREKSVDYLSKVLLSLK